MERLAKSMQHQIAVTMRWCAVPVVRLAMAMAATQRKHCQSRQVVRTIPSTGVPLTGIVHGSNSATVAHIFSKTS